jgi:hypothetical protein
VEVPVCRAAPCSFCLADLQVASSDVCVPLKIAGDGDAEVLDRVNKWDDSRVDQKANIWFCVLPRDDQK